MPTDRNPESLGRRTNQSDLDVTLKISSDPTDQVPHLSTRSRHGGRIPLQLIGVVLSSVVPIGGFLFALLLHRALWGWISVCRLGKATMRCLLDADIYM